MIFLLWLHLARSVTDERVDTGCLIRLSSHAFIVVSGRLSLDANSINIELERIQYVPPSVWSSIGTIRSIWKRPHIYTAIIRYDLAGAERGLRHPSQTSAPASQETRLHISSSRALVFRDEHCVLDLALVITTSPSIRI